MRLKESSRRVERAGGLQVEVRTLVVGGMSGGVGAAEPVRRRPSTDFTTVADRSYARSSSWIAACIATW